MSSPPNPVESTTFISSSLQQRMIPLYKEKAKNLRLMLCLKYVSSSLLFPYWKQSESESSHILWIRCVAGVRGVYLLLNLNPGTQHSVLRMGLRRPSLRQPLGNWPRAFPLSLFLLPMSSAWTKPGVCSSPQDQRPLLGGDKNCPQAFDYIRWTFIR